MLNDYDKLLREYNVPPGALSNEELRMLHEGGIPLDEGEYEEYVPHPNERVTQPKYPRVNNSVENESLRVVYEEQLSMKEKQLAFLQGELNNRDRLMEV